MILALVLVFFGGGVFGLLLAAVLGTASRQSAIERAYWSGVRASSEHEVEQPRRAG